MLASGNDNEAAFGLRDANAVPTFAPVPRVLPGFFKTFFGTFFDTFSPFSPSFLKKSPKFFAGIVLSLPVIDFSLLQIEQ